MYLIAETSEVTHQFVNPPLDGLRIWAMAAFLVFHSIVENLPHHSAELVSHGPDGFLVSELGYQPAVQVLENAALGFDGSISCLIENAPQFQAQTARATFDLTDGRFTYGPMQTWPRWPNPPIIEVMALQVYLPRGAWLVMVEGLKPDAISVPQLG